LRKLKKILPDHKHDVMFKEQMINSLEQKVKRKIKFQTFNPLKQEECQNHTLLI
jgi:hypothetical protein